MGRSFPGRKLAADHQKSAPVRPGADVRDRRVPAPDNVARVIEATGVRADEYLVDDLGRTVAEDNPAYPADDEVIRVVWHDHVDAIATLWRGWTGEQIRDVVDARSDVKPYHFPESRLVAEEHLVDVPPADLEPSPYHHRDFDVDTNRGYIHDVRRRGYIPSVVSVRPVEDGYELVDGHKRRWVAVEAGLETVAAEVLDLDDREAAQVYAEDHLPCLEGEPSRLTLAALEDGWDDELDLPELEPKPVIDGGSR